MQEDQNVKPKLHLYKPQTTLSQQNNRNGASKTSSKMKIFSYIRFRELSDKADMAVSIARASSSPEELSSELSAVLPDGTKLFTWDHDRRVWLTTLISITNVDELIPFITRHQCLQQLIEEQSEELEPSFVRWTAPGCFALHPAIYHAAGNAAIIDDNGNAKFEPESFKAALEEWVQFQGY